MNISSSDIDLFYKLHSALLQYVNQRLSIFPNIKTAKELKNSGLENVSRVWMELWKKPRFIADFVSENPANLSKDELAIVADWKYFLKGKFYIFRHLKKYSIFLTDTHSAKAYGVCSLMTPLDEMFWSENLPIYTEAILLPFRGRIIYDGILHPYSIIFGPGIRFSLKEAYRDTKSKFGVITTLGDIN